MDGSNSPRKAKGRESGFNWEYEALLDANRPVVWSSISLLFYPISNKPVVAARHLSSSKQFTLPTPASITAALAFYDAPSVISASHNADWLFAFFPSSDGEMDGIACMWRRGPAVDVWDVFDVWQLPRGAGVVSACWIGQPREWTINTAAATSTRLPSRGPQTTLSKPLLVLVNENRWATVCYFPTYGNALKRLSCSLVEPGMAVDGHPNHSSRAPGIKFCTHAAVGVGYNESSILIATRSRTLALVPETASFHPSMDLVGLEIDMTAPEPECLLDWTTCGEDQLIELCELRLTTGGSGVSLATSPLPQLHDNGLSLVNMTFVPVPPSEDGHLLYLAANFMNLPKTGSTPTSELVLYAFVRDDSRAWRCQHVGSRAFTDRVLAYTACGSTAQTTDTFGLFAGLLNTTGLGASTKSERQAGSIRVLRLPSLADHEIWGTTRVMSPLETTGREVPMGVALSPNDCMVLCATPFSFGPSQVNLQLLPRPAESHAGAPTASQIGLALLSGTSTADLSHLLSNSAVSDSQVAETLLGALKTPTQQQGNFTWRALGFVLETNRLRAKNAASPSERERLELRWKSAFDMCSLASCNSAFADCQRGGDDFDMDAVWQLDALSTWVLDFVEKVLRECVLVSNTAKLRSNPIDSEALKTSGSIMLHISHPIALRNLMVAVAYVHKFEQKIRTSVASELSSHLAKSVIVDLIDCSGVDLNALEPILSELYADASKFNFEDTQRSLAFCEPAAAMIPHIGNAVEKLSQPSVVNRSRLFIKANELVDGLSMLEVRSGDASTRDLVTKSAFQGSPVMTCVRCGGKSELGGALTMPRGSSSAMWSAWEKLWVTRCICGGAWMSNS